MKEIIHEDASKKNLGTAPSNVLTTHYEPSKKNSKREK